MRNENRRGGQSNSTWNRRSEWDRFNDNHDESRYGRNWQNEIEDPEFGGRNEARPNYEQSDFERVAGGIEPDFFVEEANSDLSSYDRSSGYDNQKGDYYGQRDNHGGYIPYSGSERDRDYTSPQPTSKGPHAFARGPKGYKRSDERIYEDVCDRLERQHDLDASHVEVKVSDAVVTLQGSVKSKSAKRIAEDCLDDISGVKEVRNEIRLTEGR